MIECRIGRPPEIVAQNRMDAIYVVGDRCTEGCRHPGFSIAPQIDDEPRMKIRKLNSFGSPRGAALRHTAAVKA
jgi:hypothetical protein